jgi:hypothetical protein
MTENCICHTWTSNSKIIEFVKISNSRTELRCGRCHGLVGWWDEPVSNKKIMPLKREWTEEECLTMR